jgi:hypothetical protein
MRLRLGLLGLGLATCFAGLTAAAADPAAAKFQRWVTAVAQQKHFSVCRWGTARFAANQPAAQFATLHSSDDDQYGLIVAWDNQKRAYLSQKAATEGPACAGDGKPAQAAKWEESRTIAWGPWGERPKSSVNLAVVGNQVVLVQSNEGDDTMADVVDWDKLEEAHKVHADKVAQDGAILLITDPAAPLAANLPRARNWVTFESPPLKGPADAAVQARVTVTADALRIALVAEDDVDRPLLGANLPDAAFLKADHFEIWYCAAAAKPRCNRKDARQLGIARLPDGSWHVRYLLPVRNKERLPALEPLGPRAVTVVLPLAQIRHDGSPEISLEGELTAVYSDADEHGVQEAVVATSKLRWGDGGSFGRFVRHSDGTRFPTWEGSAGLDPNEKFFADLPGL